MGYKIAIFSFNTASIGIIETMKPEVKKANRSSCINTWYEGMYPDFFKHLISIIITYQPDVIIFGLQEDRYPGSYFHSHFLPENMNKYGYTLLKQNMLMGVGITSYKNLLNLDPMTRGLTTSIYASDYAYAGLVEGEIEIRQEMGGDGQDYYLHNKITRGKGGTAAYIKFPNTNTIAIINSHLPFSAGSLIDSIRYSNPIMRQTQINDANYCLNSIIEALVIKKGFTPKYAILFGDLNYRINYPSSSVSVANMLSSNPSRSQIATLIEHDELRREMSKGNIHKLNEGYLDQGPMFLPTSKMIKKRRYVDTSISGSDTEMPDEEIKLGIAKTKEERGDVYWNTGKYGQRTPSWCDRILYGTFKDYNKNRVDDSMDMECIYYNRFECGACINNSDHVAVVSIFKIK
jgi:hypothetical protein